MAQFQFDSGLTEQRGSLLRTQPAGSAGVGKIGIPWIRYAGGQVTAGTGITGLKAVGTSPVTFGKVGESSGSKQLTITGLGVTTADVFGCQLTISEVWDIDLTQPIYFDNLVFCKTGMSDGDTLAMAWQYASLPTAPVGLADVSTDNVANFTANSSTYTVVAATDLESYRNIEGAYIGGGVITSNVKPIYFHFTCTLGTASANEFVIMETNIRYTRRFV